MVPATERVNYNENLGASQPLPGWGCLAVTTRGLLQLQVPAVSAVLYIDSYSPLVLSRWMLKKPGHAIGISECPGLGKENQPQDYSVLSDELSSYHAFGASTIIAQQPTCGTPNGEQAEWWSVLTDIGLRKIYRWNLDNYHTSPTHYLSEVDRPLTLRFCERTTCLANNTSLTI